MKNKEKKLKKRNDIVARRELRKIERKNKYRDKKKVQFEFMFNE